VRRPRHQRARCAGGVRRREERGGSRRGGRTVGPRRPSGSRVVRRGQRRGAGGQGRGRGTCPPPDTAIRSAGPWLTLPACVLEAGEGGVVARAWPRAGALRHPTAPPPQVAGGVEARLTAPRGPAAARALPPAAGQALHRGNVPGHGGHASLKRPGAWHAPWRRPAVTRGGGLAARRRQRASTGDIVCGLRHLCGLPPAQLHDERSLCSPESLKRMGQHVW
jgi:hypothetical protein